ncbi:hypothetical protein EJ08DRAFT_734357 [Tothia fuscella]|uniref:F-box domain-containing protein n=1 Tax=Tothia fuscella TaxID=1048955 RepID=A0A9P4NR13_9PEZI|nr:hypothetical protein EJ08DRAFT_734357 [Tothia fuscella]
MNLPPPAAQGPPPPFPMVHPPHMLPPFAPGVAPSFPVPPPLPPPQLPPIPPQPFGLPPAPPPPSWRGLSHFVNQRPTGHDLTAFDKNCNAVKQNGLPCSRAAHYFPKNALPVCKLHKKKRLCVGYCKAVEDGKLCNKTIKWKPPFFELCHDHRDWDGMPCHILKLPTELRLQIFQYLLPDRPVSAWLDRSLRSDSYKCTTSLLLVNKEFYSEASDVLYRTQPFTVSIQRNAINLCGRCYYHDLSGSQHTTPNSNPQRLPVRPPMLDKIKNVRIQMTMVKPSSRLHRRHNRTRPNWDEEVEAYDMRDSVKCFVKMLQTSKALQTFSLVFCTQNQLDVWDDDRQLEFLKFIADPFEHLRSIPSVIIHPIYHSTDHQRMNVTQYILDNLSPSLPPPPPQPILNIPGWLPPPPPPLPLNGLAGFVSVAPASLPIPGPNFGIEGHDGIHWTLSNSLDAFGGRAPVTAVSKRLHDNDSFLAYKSHWEGTISSKTAPPLQAEFKPASKAYKAFQHAYLKVDRHYLSKLPKGKEWMLHRARVAREKCDINAIRVLHMELAAKVDEYLADEKKKFEEKTQVLERRLKRCGIVLGELAEEKQEGGDSDEERIGEDISDSASLSSDF